MAEAAEEVEDWVALTQATLGQFIAKPRMLAERLRKPPFRFLFDIAAEVARQTGFGVQELFGGEVSMKPSVPGTREEKVSFLECWISLTSAMLGQQAPSIALVSAQSIVCGIHPELTNYLLQCTAAAGWPENCALPAPPVVTTTVEEAYAAQASEGQSAPSPEPYQEAPPAAAPAAVPLQESPQVPAPSLEEQLCPSLNVEQARNIAAGMDFTTALQEYDQMHEEFARTTGTFNRVSHASPEPAPDQAAAPAPAAADEAAAEARPATAAPLEHAAAVSEKVNNEIQRAADLLACIEEGLDEADAKIHEKREAEARRQQEAADAAARAEAEAQAQAEEEARQIAEREALKRQEKEAARARRKAEKEAAELAAKFPMSKTSLGQSARIVCGGFDEEGEAEGGEEEDAGSGKAEAKQADEGGLAGSALPMSGCFTDELIGSSSSSKPPPASLGFLTSTPKEASLFERLKGELKDTFVSYLCASMPESLLKKYQPDELIGCLQLLLTELRSCIAKNNLEDVHDEEPTSLAEDLHKEFPNDWLPHLQGASPWSLRQRYDLPELIDTLQGLGQTCFERLTDELGPITQWASEDSPLRKPPAEPPAPVVYTQEDSPVHGDSSPFAGFQSQAAMSSAASPMPSPPPAGAAAGPWTAELGPAPWEAAGPPATAAPPTRAGAPPTAGGHAGAPPTRGGAPLAAGPPPTAGGQGSAAAHLQTVQQSSGRTTSPAPAPVFSAALGPAPWEVDTPTSGPAVAPATAARMPTGAGRMPTAQRQPMHGAQRPMTQQPPRTAGMHQGFVVTSR